MSPPGSDSPLRATLSRIGAPGELVTAAVMAVGGAVGFRGAYAQDTLIFLQERPQSAGVGTAGNPDAPRRSRGLLLVRLDKEKKSHAEVAKTHSRNQAPSVKSRRRKTIRSGFAVAPQTANTPHHVGITWASCHLARKKGGSRTMRYFEKEKLQLHDFHYSPLL